MDTVKISVGGNNLNTNLNSTNEIASDTTKLWPGFDKYFKLIKIEKSCFIVRCLLCVTCYIEAFIDTKEIVIQSQESCRGKIACYRSIEKV